MVPVDHHGQRVAGGGPEVRADGVSDWDQRLHNRLERDPQQLGRPALMAQVEGRPDRAEPASGAASMKLQAAGMIDPHREACTTTGAWSVRPSSKGSHGPAPDGYARPNIGAPRRCGPRARRRRPRHTAPGRSRRRPRHSSPSAARRSGSVITMRCQYWACWPSGPAGPGGCTPQAPLAQPGRVRSSRLRTLRVVASSSSGVRSNRVPGSIPRPKRTRTPSAGG
jgi:hypothetical protein